MKKYGLIGKPLSHSFSGKFFNEKFEREGIDAIFELYEIDTAAELVNLVKQKPDLKGLAVTIPYKKDVIPLLSSVDDTAMEIGAVNCIHIRETEMVGYNTDVVGFEKSLLNFLPLMPAAALVLGSGGAALSVKYVLSKLEVPFHVVSRNPAQQEMSYNSITEKIIQQYPLIINTTPVGTYPAMDACLPIPYHSLNKDHYLFDLVYNPAETLFLKKGREQGAQTCNGKEMLELQAEENWKIWNQG